MGSWTAGGSGWSRREGTGRGRGPGQDPDQGREEPDQGRGPGRGHVTGAVPRGTGRPPLPSPTRVQEADLGRGREGRGPGAAPRETSSGLSFVGQQNDIAL